jgi:hypothetical protein
MTDAKGQPITRPAGEGRVRATAGDFHASGSWWFLLAVSATGANTVRSDLAAPLLKWLIAGLVALSWLRRARTTRATNRPLTGAP